MSESGNDQSYCYILGTVVLEIRAFLLSTADLAVVDFYSTHAGIANLQLLKRKLILRQCTKNVNSQKKRLHHSARNTCTDLHCYTNLCERSGVTQILQKIFSDQWVLYSNCELILLNVLRCTLFSSVHWIKLLFFKSPYQYALRKTFLCFVTV